MLETYGKMVSGGAGGSAWWKGHLLCALGVTDWPLCSALSGWRKPLETQLGAGELEGAGYSVSSRVLNTLRAPGPTVAPLLCEVGAGVPSVRWWQWAADLVTFSLFRSLQELSYNRARLWPTVSSQPRVGSQSWPAHQPARWSDPSHPEPSFCGLCHHPAIPGVLVSSRFPVSLQDRLLSGV